MFGRTEDATLSGAHTEELGAADLAAVEDRNYPGKVIEDVESGSCLDDCGERDDGPPDDKCLRECVHLIESPDGADEEIEDKHEAEQEHQRLRHLGRRRLDATGVRDDGGESRSDDRDERPLESGAPQLQPAVDEQRCAPNDNEEGDKDPVRLELERKACGGRWVARWGEGGGAEGDV